MHPSSRASKTHFDKFGKSFSKNGPTTWVADVKSLAVPRASLR